MNQYDDVKTVETVIGSRSSFDISFEINSLIYFDILEQINSEIGTIAFDYSLLIKPQIDIVVNVDKNEVTDSFVPILKFKTNRYTPGSVYEFEGMTHESDEKLTTTETITHPEVRMWRYASYVTTIISCTALVYMAWLAIQDRKKEDTRQSEKMINKFQDMIAKVSEKTKIETL